MNIKTIRIIGYSFLFAALSIVIPLVLVKALKLEYDQIGVGLSLIAFFTIYTPVIWLFSRHLDGGLAKFIRGRTAKYGMYTLLALSFWSMAMLLSMSINFIALISGIELQTVSPSVAKSLNEKSLVGPIIVGAILPGIFEEILFRGFILKSISTKLGTLTAVIISSFVFGIMHISIINIAYATVLGAGFAYVTVKSKSLLPAITAHVILNSWTLITHKCISIYGEPVNVAVKVIIFVLIFINAILIQFFEQIFKSKSVITNTEEVLNG